MKAIDFIKLVATKSLTGNRGSGIRTIPSAMAAEAKTGEFLAILQKAGIPISQLDDYIRSEADVSKFLNIIKNANKPRVIPGTSTEGKAITEKLFGKRGEVIEGNFGKSFKEEIDAMKKSGDLVDEKDMVISDKITDREMFKNSNLNKPTIEGQMEKINKASNRINEIKKEQAAMYKPKVDTVEETVTYIKTLEPMTALKEANLVIGRKGKYKDLTPDQSKKILKDTEDHIFERDIPDEDFAKGGRAGYSVGSMVSQAGQAREGIESRLEQLGGDVTSAEKMLQQINERLESAGSSVPEGGGLGGLLGEGGVNSGSDVITSNPFFKDPNITNLNQLPVTAPTTPSNPNVFKDPVTGGGQPFYGPGEGLGGLLDGPQQGRVPGNPELAGPVSSIGLLTVMPPSVGDNIDPYSNTALSGLSQDGQKFNSAQSAFDAFVEQTKKRREQSPYTRDVIGSERYQGEEGFKDFTNYFNTINAPGYSAPQLQPLASSQQNLQKALPGLFAKGGRAGYGLGSIVTKRADDVVERVLPEEFNVNKNQNMSGVDSRMSLDYDTLVEQNVDKRLQDSDFLNNIKDQDPVLRERELNPPTTMPVSPLLPVEPRNQPDSLEEYLAGYKDYAAKNPNTYAGTQALIPATLPGGFNYTFRSGPHANHFNDYLRSIGLSPYKQYADEYMIEKFNQGGRAGYYTGGITDVEPSLDDIGHGAEAMNSRTRLMSPGNQATTSTGLNYLLAEDNDNMRIPFSVGGGGRRAFLKFLASIGGLTAAAKSGMIGLGEGGAKKAVTETVKQSAGSGYPPPYFFKLVEKIKFMGDDTLATKDKAIAKKYKDYTMEEDFAGNIEIIKKGDNVSEDVFMSLKVDEVPIKGKNKSTKVQEYEEYTARPDAEGKMKDIEQGVPDEVIDEAGDTTAMTLKKADGGRIGFKLGGSGKKFIEKIFGKGSLDVMKSRDPELHKGMLEVVDMFRNRDKEGLKMYLQKFLPHMDDETIEAFIVGDAVDAAGQGKFGLDNISGQLIRLGSGRDYAGKIKAMKKLDDAKKLDNLDVTEQMIRKPNASGGIQTMLGE